MIWQVIGWGVLGVGVYVGIVYLLMRYAVGRDTWEW
jgi:hypothetical protein